MTAHTKRSPRRDEEQCSADQLNEREQDLTVIKVKHLEREGKGDRNPYETQSEDSNRGKSARGNNKKYGKEW